MAVDMDRDEDRHAVQEDWDRKDGGSLLDIRQTRRPIETRVVECNEDEDAVDAVDADAVDEDIDAAEEDIPIGATRKRNS